jgi:hypothetical protein
MDSRKVWIHSSISFGLGRDFLVFSLDVSVSNDIFHSRFTDLDWVDRRLSLLPLGLDITRMPNRSGWSQTLAPRLVRGTL